jgi:SpoVK/Ycf46/Vps4 family AAA+-type ATPase
MIDMKTYKMLHAGAQEDSAAVEAELDSASMAADELPQEPFVFLLPNEIKGYNLRTKKWGKCLSRVRDNLVLTPCLVDLEVDRIVDILWNVTAFESLVTDDRTKELIHALVTNQLAAEKATDLISGKGNGLIMLLHSGPGTGKTFTAESVAEIAQKPLYRVTCGDFGTNPEEIEKYLESVLHLGKIWSCVVLLDEADIFLEERTLADLQRNALVSTFLRALEYYSGILILTSNRVGHFDEAFKSRIQLALHHKNLDQRQRWQIWRNFLQRLQDLEEKDVDFGDLDKHIDDLAENQMNGRQIRNAITTARQLAIYRKRDLDYRSLQDVIETSSMFDEYLLELNEGNSDDAIARGMGNR